MIDDEKSLRPVHAFGLGLRQAQIGVQSSFTIDARAALHTNENIKVLVTSKNFFSKIPSQFFLLNSTVKTSMSDGNN